MADAETTIRIKPGGQGVFRLDGGDYDGRVGMFLDNSDVIFLKVDGMGRGWFMGNAAFDTPENREKAARILTATAQRIIDHGFASDQGLVQDGDD